VRAGLSALLSAYFVVIGVSRLSLAQLIRRLMYHKRRRTFGFIEEA